MPLVSNISADARGRARAGTERCHEAVTRMGEQYDIVINIQGDEPLMEPHIIDDVVLALKHSPDAVYRRAAVGGGAPAYAGPAAAGPSSQQQGVPVKAPTCMCFIFL